MVGTTPSSNPCHDLAREALALLLDHPEDFRFDPTRESHRKSLGETFRGDDFWTFVSHDKGLFWRSQPTWIPHANIVLNAFRAARQGWLEQEVALDIGETYQESLHFQLRAIEHLEMPAPQLRALQSAYERQLDGLRRLVDGDQRGETLLREGAVDLRAATTVGLEAPSMACCSCGKTGPKGTFCAHCSAKQPRWLSEDSGTTIDIQENAVPLETGPVVLKVLEAIDSVESRGGCLQHFENVLDEAFDGLGKMIASLSAQACGADQTLDRLVADAIESGTQLQRAIERVGFFSQDQSPNHLLVGREQLLGAAAQLEGVRQELLRAKAA